MTDSNTNKPRILVIDDEPFFLQLLTEALSEKFQISLAKNGRQGLTRAEGEAKPDLILLDVVMPEMDGYETCKALKENIYTREIPVIFLTAKRDVEDELKGFNLGAVDYITKPISIPILLTRVQTQLALSQQKIALEQLVQERTREIEVTKDAIVYSMGEMAEARDKETGNHLLRTKEYVRVLAEQLATTDKYKSVLTTAMINAFQRAAPLHDIGKIAVPDSVLLKEGPLDNDERKIMDLHPVYGKTTIENSESKIGSTLFITIAKEIAYSHHERWDGSGYPQCLKQEKIPLSARLMALADVYDALVSKRCYKEAMLHDEAVSLIAEARGSHFDPDIIDSFIAVKSEFKIISDQYKDE
ncbi:MAG: response regulator [Gammaproteobacteria bacterium]|jgi:putative two-component system response regulator|nr:response regulator [Gammaproteobacteria bacterium]MBT3722518.1 response regulator [Gammaproteobacteria bacterium]MBT4078711.1 response regulator [Gammaproteobacteria bacterium]MBT4196766.1 response regulator [Gammaproteobacteria bacterium]MBT4450820.1 response regulator [Gammaproteobacteria bacterium]